jgi:hypothetical protein
VERQKCEELSGTSTKLFMGVQGADGAIAGKRVKWLYGAIGHARIEAG